MGDYRGATTAASFGNPQAEWSAVRLECGVYDLGFRAKISLTGGDRVRWLNGMVTNNVRDLAAGSGVYAFLLNPQGHILGDLCAYNRGESIAVDTDCSQLEKILATFDHYIIMDDVEAKSLKDELSAIGVCGPRAKQTLHDAGIEVLAETHPLQIFEATCGCDCACTHCTAVRGENPDLESYELWLAPGDVRKTWDALVAHGATPVGYEALELQRISTGIPLYGIDIRERDLPQETEQARALNFNKGCYIGQEIVERIRSRGAVHRKFSGFMAEGAEAIAPGMKIVAAEKEVGEITSAAALQMPGGYRTIALGYLRRELSIAGREVLIGNTTASVIPLPAEAPSRECTPLRHPA